MSPHRAAALALLLSPLAACRAHVPPKDPVDQIIHDSGRCDAVWVGTDFSPCHWHYFGVGVDPGTSLSRALGPDEVTELPITAEAFPVRWFSVQVRSGVGPTWPSPFALAARLHACGDGGCGLYFSGYWEPWQKAPGLVHRWVLGAAAGYRFESHFDWSDGKVLEQVFGPHAYAAPAVAFDLWSQPGDRPGTFSPSPHLQLEVGWSF